MGGTPACYDSRPGSSAEIGGPDHDAPTDPREARRVPGWLTNVRPASAHAATRSQPSSSAACERAAIIARWMPRPRSAGRTDAQLCQPTPSATKSDAAAAIRPSSSATLRIQPGVRAICGAIDRQSACDVSGAAVRRDDHRHPRRRPHRARSSGSSARRPAPGRTSRGAATWTSSRSRGSTPVRRVRRVQDDLAGDAVLLEEVHRLTDSARPASANPSPRLNIVEAIEGAAPRRICPSSSIRISRPAAWAARHSARTAARCARLNLADKDASSAVHDSRSLGSIAAMLSRCSTGRVAADAYAGLDADRHRPSRHRRGGPRRGRR